MNFSQRLANSEDGKIAEIEIKNDGKGRPRENIKMKLIYREKIGLARMRATRLLVGRKEGRLLFPLDAKPFAKPLNYVWRPGRTSHVACETSQTMRNYKRMTMKSVKGAIKAVKSRIEE